MEVKDRICLALDVDSLEQAADLAKRLSPWIGMFKIGFQLFTSAGPQVVEAVLKGGGRVFLDLKYHDIPNTVAQAARVVTRMGVTVFNVHCLGGVRMMEGVAEAVREEAVLAGVKQPLVLGVTVLTSHGPDELKKELHIPDPLEDYVTHLASNAKKAGLGGVVCSPHEIARVRKACGPDFVLVTPGIRPAWSVSKDDQKRIMTPAKAIATGATHIVIGRPILQAKDPEMAAKRLLEEIQGQNRAA